MRDKSAKRKNYEMKLTDGVQLHIIKTKKFKTMRIMLRFRSPIDPESLGKRVLISNLWETTNAVYPTAQAFSRRLSELYGANFSTSVSKKGRQHLLSLNMSFVNPTFLDFDSLSASIDFLKAVIFRPDTVGDSFNPEVFEREKVNLSHYLASMNDDRGYYASRQLSELFFEEPRQSLPSVANEALIAVETASSVYAYYQKMLAEDNIDIILLGDLSEAEERAAEQAFAAFPFEARAEFSEVLYQQKLRPIERKVENKEVAQSILQLAYRLPVSYGDEDYLALQVFNGLFGGFAHSKLFVNVREKAQLAYSAGSTFDSFSGVLKVAIGIDAAKYEEALSLTKAQLTALQAGDFTENEVEQTKILLRNSYYVGQDSAGNLMEMDFIKALMPERHLSGEAFLAQLETVSKKDVVRVAQKLDLQAEYFMKGTAYNGEN